MWLLHGGDWNPKVTHSVHLPSLPVAEALKNFQDQLTRLEQEEIMDYSEIWFMGLSSQKIEGSQDAPQNCGYDDEHGSYIRVMEEIRNLPRSVKIAWLDNTIFHTFAFIFKSQKLWLVA